MNAKFEEVSTAGIINPGHLYIMHEVAERNADADSIDFLPSERTKTFCRPSIWRCAL
jgi:hypothetical protein